MFEDDRPRLLVLQDHFGLIEDDREPWQRLAQKKAGSRFVPGR
jgi:hypothetical protein